MTMTKNELIFAENLDRKLQKIEYKNNNVYKSADQINNNISNNNKNNNKSLQNLYNNKNINNNLNNNRPQFITTVKTGIFLDPPHEIAILLGLNKDKRQASNSSPTSNNSLNSTETVKVTEKPVVMYSYSSRPKIMNHNKNYHANCGTKTRSKRSTTEMNNANVNDEKRDGQQLPYGNIMYDRRVVRGSTYANYPMPTPKWNPNFGYAKLLSENSNQENVESQASKRQEARRRALARKKAKGYCIRGRMGTPPPVCGRKHEPVQTERYLEEIFDRPVEAEAACQTDLFLDRPATPLYVPAKTGVDEATQIWPGELFDFDVEVVPILEVLVGKTIEQSLIEVLEEDEIAQLQAQQRRFMELRAAEKAEQQRLEEQEQQVAAEKNARMAEHEGALRIQKETEERVAAAMLSEGYIADLLPNVLDGLKEAGFLVDEIKSNVDHNFMPWLMQEVKEELAKMISSRDVLGEIIREILETRAELYRAMGDNFEGEEEVEETKQSFIGEE